MDENKDGASDTSCHRAGIASQLSPHSRSSLSECSSLTQDMQRIAFKYAMIALFGDDEFVIVPDDEESYRVSFGSLKTDIFAAIEEALATLCVSDGDAQREDRNGLRPEGMPARPSEGGIRP